MGEMMASVAVIAPALRRSLADLEHNLERAMQESRSRRYDNGRRR
jgi:hypothetical protein